MAIQRTAPAATNPCSCRSEHAPRPPWTHGHHVWPLSWGGPDVPANIRYICPATHDWVHLIMREFTKNDGPVPRRADWPLYAYRLANEGWTAWVNAGRPVRKSRGGDHS